MIRKASEDGFWWTRDEESYHGGPCATREEALADAISDGTFEPGDTITTAWCTIHHLKLSAFFDADRLLEDIEDNQVDDYQNEDGDAVFDVTPDQKADLQAMVRAAIDEWEVKHGLKFSSWYFANCTQSEQHTMPGEPESVEEDVA